MKCRPLLRHLTPVLIILILVCATDGRAASSHPVTLVEVQTDSRESAEWLSRFNVRLASPGALLLEIEAGDEDLLQARGLRYRLICDIDGEQVLYCCPLEVPVPPDFERLWSSEVRRVQVIGGRGTPGTEFLERHMGVMLPRDACATSWFAAEAPRAADGRSVGGLAKRVAEEISGENLEQIINELSYDAAAGTLLTRYSFRAETLERAMPYVRDRLVEYLGSSEAVNLQEFELHSVTGPVRAVNVIGSLEGDVDGAGYYVLCGHYDSIAIRTSGWDGMRDPAPGADDNASGVAAVLECARALATVPLDLDIKFILFSGEEQAIKGSSYFVNELIDPSADGALLGVINLDMIAFNQAGDTLEIVTDARSSWLADFIVESYDDLAAEVGELAVSSVQVLRYPFSDDSAFQTGGYPAVTCIEKRDVEEHNPNYHMVGDHNIDGKLNISQATKTVRLVAGALAALAGKQDVPDLEILPTDLVFSSPPFPVVNRAEVGDSVTISVRVRNVGGPIGLQGGGEGHSVIVKVYDDDPAFGGTLIAEQEWEDPIPALGGIVFKPTWVPEEDDKGSHRITAVVSLEGGRGEEVISNNSARTTFAIVADRMDLLENYVFPNPADPSGSASLHYFLTQPAAVEVDVFDAMGRRVGGTFRPQLGGRIPNVNFMEIKVPMTEVIDGYEDLPGGVYFYSIIAWNEELRVEKKGRFIMVR